jgi:PiT family inorganic phosphate transporter
MGILSFLADHPLIAVTFVTALAFDFVNGFHDAANSIATVVATRVLHPKWAVAWAAFFNFIAAFTFGVAVAKTVGKGVVHTDMVTVPVVLSGLFGAISWNLITWWLALPSSSSHALIGGYAGAAVAFGGFDLLVPEGLIKVALFIVISPVVGMLLALAVQSIVLLLVKRMRPRTASRLFRKLQLVSAAVYSFSHGTNDAQKTLGILFALLVSGGFFQSTQDPPFSLLLLCHIFIALGTLFGGYKIIRTMGMKLTKLDPMHGFCAETGGGVTILAVSALGIPVSTTHTITGGIVGVGMTSGLGAVRWMLAGRIVWAWILTIPMSAFLAGLFYALVGQFLPT